MKKIIFVTLMLCVCLYNNAQVYNSRNEKVVKSIIVKDLIDGQEIIRTKYCFSYNNEYELISMSKTEYRDNHTFKDSVYIHNNKMYGNFYIDNKKDNTKYEYVYVNGYLQNCKETSINTEKTITKINTYYTYDKYGNFLNVEYKKQYQEKNQNIINGSDNNIYYLKNYQNSLYMFRFNKQNNVQRKFKINPIYDNKINDTNINLSMFVLYWGSSEWFNNFLLLTEWVHFNFKELPIKTVYTTTEYYYTNDNLVKMRVELLNNVDLYYINYEY